MGVCASTNKKNTNKNIIIEKNIKEFKENNEHLSSNRDGDDKIKQNIDGKDNEIENKKNITLQSEISSKTIDQINNDSKEENILEVEKENQIIKNEIEGIFIGINIGSLKTIYSKFTNFNKKYRKYILQSDVSNNYFLSKICYTKTHRLCGQISEPYISKNINSSYNNLSRLIGFHDSYLYQLELPYMFNQVNSIDKISFNYPKNNIEILNHINVLCDYLSFINKFLFNNNNEFYNIKNFTICVPDYYTLYQKQELSLICEILDMKNYNIINESSAVTIYYGYTIYYNYFFNYCKDDLSQPDKILFIDFGNSKINYVISSFKKNEFKVEKVLCNPFLGGRNLDEKIFNEIIAFFINNNNIEETLNLTDKKRIELLKAIAEARNKLSLNETSKIQIFAFYKGIDLEYIFTKKDLNYIISDEIQTFKNDLSNILNEYENDIKYVEMYGNVMRTLILESLLKENYNLILQKSIIIDECLSTGASIYGYYRINHKSNQSLFSHFIEYNNYTILYSINDELKENIVFEKGIIKEYEKKINLPSNVDIIKIKFFYDKDEINHIGLDCFNIIEYEINLKSQENKNNIDLIININLNEPKIHINNQLVDISINKIDGFLYYKNDKEKIINDMKNYLKENDVFENDYFDYSNERNELSQKIYNIMIDSKKQNLEIDEKQLKNDLKFLHEHEQDKNIRKEKINEIIQRINLYTNQLNNI
jgi:hypothetical protein